jgi:hypothetical protein
MSSCDVELWNTLVTSILKSAGAKGVTRLEVLKRVSDEISGELWVHEIITKFFHV